MVVLPIFGVMAVDPLIFQAAGRRVVFVFRVVRQGLIGQGEGGVEIAVLNPAVAGENEIAQPTCWRRGLFCET